MSRKLVDFIERNKQVMNILTEPFFRGHYFTAKKCIICTDTLILIGSNRESLPTINNLNVSKQ